MSMRDFIKFCPSCRQKKPASEFYKNRTSKDGLQSYCKVCIRENNKNWAASNPEKSAAYQRKYRAANIEKVRERNKQAHRASRITNPDKDRIAARTYRAAHPDKHKASRVAYYERNKEKIRERDRTRYAANPGKKDALNRIRRARKCNAGGTHTVKDIEQLKALQKMKCVYCKEKLDKGFHVDHIIALVNGGTNDRYNLQLLCPDCNLRKNRKDHILFANQYGLLL